MRISFSIQTNQRSLSETGCNLDPITLVCKQRGRERALYFQQAQIQSTVNRSNRMHTQTYTPQRSFPAQALNTYLCLEVLRAATSATACASSSSSPPTAPAKAPPRERPALDAILGALDVGPAEEAPACFVAGSLLASVAALVAPASMPRLLPPSAPGATPATRSTAPSAKQNGAL